MATPEWRDLVASRANQYLEEHIFAVGDLVRWKPGLRNRNIPVYGAPCVVMEVLDPPLIEEGLNAGSTYFREPITLKLAIVDEDEELVFFHFDGNRFEKAT